MTRITKLQLSIRVKSLSCYRGHHKQHSDSRICQNLKASHRESQQLVILENLQRWTLITGATLRCVGNVYNNQSLPWLLKTRICLVNNRTIHSLLWLHLLNQNVRSVQTCRFVEIICNDILKPSQVRCLSLLINHNQVINVSKTISIKSSRKIRTLVSLLMNFLPTCTIREIV